MLCQNINNILSIIGNKIFHVFNMSHELFNWPNIIMNDIKTINIRFIHRIISKYFLIHNFKISISKIHVKLIRILKNYIHSTTRSYRFKIFFTSIPLWFGWDSKRSEGRSGYTLVILLIVSKYTFHLKNLVGSYAINILRIKVEQTLVLSFWCTTILTTFDKGKNSNANGFMNSLWRRIP